jgi:hypothetical protein
MTSCTNTVNVPRPLIPLFTSNGNAFATEHVAVSADLHMLYYCKMYLGIRNLNAFVRRVYLHLVRLDPDSRYPVNNNDIASHVNTEYALNQIRIEYAMYYFPLNIFVFEYFLAWYISEGYKKKP